MGLSAFLIVALMFGTSYWYKASATVPGTNTLVSVNDTGNGQGGDGNSDPYTQPDGGNPSISGNGKLVLFNSTATNLISGDTNASSDTFVRNLATNTTTRVDVSSSGVEANAGSTGTTLASPAAISRTGRYIAFASDSTNLIDGQTISAFTQLYLRDQQTGTTTLLSKTASGAPSGITYGVYGVSSDGRFVLFSSSATNLDPNASTAGNLYLYRLDRQTGTFQALNSTSLNAYRPMVQTAAMSCDGSEVIDSEFQDSLTSDDTNTFQNVYLFDFRNGQTIKDITAAETQASFEASISCNGDYVAFESQNSAYSPIVTNGYDHMYVYSRVDDTFNVADQSTSGVIGNDNVLGVASVDDNGDMVFASNSTNLGTGTSSHTQIWFHNYTTGTTEMLSRSSGGTLGNSNSIHPMISADGKIATYDSYATNLISSDTNAKADTFTSLTGL